MTLLRSRPSPDGHDRRVFECPNCKELLQLFLTPDDPLEKVGGYLSSDLAPPQ